jgi:preprotein translocase subunit Sec61beta
MARDNKINLPSSGAGLTRYFDDAQSSINITPQAVIMIILGVVVILLLLTSF